MADIVVTGQKVTSKCPACGAELEREAYDIGSGPELSCVECEWCWGANGQPLNPVGSPALHEFGKEER